MTTLSRRSFLQLAAAFGATAAWGTSLGAASAIPWRERRDLYPEGVASAEPHSDSILLWTRHTPLDSRAKLTVELAEDFAFQKVIATTSAPVSSASDWTTRVLIGNLKPSRTYFYRFSDAAGNGSRIGRTLTAPAPDDPHPVRFAFVSCQNANDGAQNAYRRMIYEDERAPDADKLGFVLHLGDFIYELVWYPEDRPQGMYDRKIRDLVRYAHGEKIDDFHIPTTVDDYRAVYRAYLHDPDLQDARAHFPFVNMWDNHEFSWKGWQGVQNFDGKNRPAQTRKVAAMQAFFEYQPARMARPNSASLDQFEPPKVTDAAITRFDDHGLGQEPNNLTAVASLKGYRTLRYGRNVDLIITDQRSYRSEEPTDRPEATAFTDKAFPELFPQEAMEILDAGRAYNDDHPPESIRFGTIDVPNFRKGDPPQTILGAEQKSWFLDQLRKSQATWKIWGNTTGTLDFRVDPQNLPPGVASKPWPGAGYAGFGGGDHSCAYCRARRNLRFRPRARHHRLRDHCRRPSQLLGRPRRKIPAAGTIRTHRHRFRHRLDLRPRPRRSLRTQFPEKSPAPRAVRRTGTRRHRAAARGKSPPPPRGRFLSRIRKIGRYRQSPRRSPILTSPHTCPSSTWEATAIPWCAPPADTFETEFVCIPRPIERSQTEDGGPLAYRVRHTARLWKEGETPKLTAKILEGDPRFSI